jgi:hypothetical protein
MCLHFEIILRFSKRNAFSRANIVINGVLRWDKNCQTNLIVFRIQGSVRRNNNLVFNDEQLETVDDFFYVPVIIIYTGIYIIRIKYQKDEASNSCDSFQNTRISKKKWAFSLNWWTVRNRRWLHLCPRNNNLYWNLYYNN